MGIVDPTAGVLAGMFIDRMRAAAQAETVPQQTIAQQVMAPPAPAPAQVPPAPQPGAPAGLGAIAPQGGAPMPEAPMAAPQEAPMGMAEGGLAGLPVPDGMFDEPSNGGFNDGYAGGGIVALADGGPALEDEFDATFGRPAQPQAPSYYGYSMDPRQNMAIARELMGTPETKYSGMLEKDMLETIDPAAMEKRRKSRTWDAVTELGLRLMGTSSPNFLSALGEAGMGTLPGVREAARLDKADQKFARKALADLESGRNTQKAQLAGQAIQMQQMAIQGYEAQTGRDFQATQNQLNRDLELRITNIKEAGDNRRAAMRARSSGSGSAGTKPLSPTQKGEAMTRAAKQASAAYKAARAAEQRGDVAEAERQLQQYGAARAIYNRFAGERGEVGLTQADLSRSAFPKLNDYVTKNKVMPSGARSPSYDRKRGVSAGGGGGGVPKGVTQAEWNAMTPQERALFR